MLFDLYVSVENVGKHEGKRVWVFWNAEHFQVCQCTGYSHHFPIVLSKCLSMLDSVPFLLAKW